MNKKSIIFKSGDLWFDFVAYLQLFNRYILDGKTQEFVDLLLLSAQKRCKIIRAGRIFYRARVGHREIRRKQEFLPEKVPLLKKEMWGPPRGKAREGRINPKGISYLYLSNNIVTAVSETRPWLDQFVTVAHCEIRTDIKVVNTVSKLSGSDAFPFLEKDATAEEKENCIWYFIDRAFSEPVMDSELCSDYVPTQYLAEALKNAGYDGIMYKSSLSHGGCNLALFTPFPDLRVKIKERELHKVNKVRYHTYKYHAYKFLK